MLLIPSGKSLLKIKQMRREISESECAACFGQWEDDEAEEWLKCTNDKCGDWSHAECLEKSDDAYVCVLFQTCFI